MKVIYTKTVKIYLWELVEILYLKNYFGFKSTAKQYVDSLTIEVNATIHLKRRKKAPPYFSRYGKDLWYASYPKNKNTTWYFFFTLYADDIYVIRYISNNHISGQMLDEELL